MIKEARLMPWFGGGATDACLVLDKAERHYLEVAVALALSGGHTMTIEQEAWCADLQRKLHRANNE